MKRKSIIAVIALTLAAIPAIAVFKEKDLKQTLLVLLSELTDDYDKVVNRSASSAKRIQSQHQSLVNLVEQSNELSLMLYSQPQNHTFDLTYALHKVTDQYEKFDANRMPFDEIIQNMSIELDRYSKLAQTLRNMPPVKIDPSLVPQVDGVMDTLSIKVDTLLHIPSFALKEGYRMDDETAAIRDSCLFYAESMVDHYMDAIKMIEVDAEDYAATDNLLKEAYDYAQNRYHVVQTKVFLEGQRNYFVILRGLGRNISRAVSDMKVKYSAGAVDERGTYSDWRGPIVAIYGFVMLVILIFAMILATFVVKLTVKKVKFFQMPYFQEHKGMLIALTGVVIFSIVLLFNSHNWTGTETFINLASTMMVEYAWLLAAIFTSLLIRLNEEQTYPALKAYLPTLILGFIIVFFRTIFIPNSALNIVFPLLVLLFTVWQLLFNRKYLGLVPRSDRILLWGSALVMAVSTVISWYGLVMMGVIVLVWWFFQLALMQTITALNNLLGRNFEKSVKQRQLSWRKRNPTMPISSGKGAFIEVTWAHDLMEMSIVPVLTILTIPLAISLACNVFNLNVVASDFFYNPLINVEGLHLSLFKLFLVVCLFFLFRYLVYVTKAFYRVIRTRAILEKMGDGAAFKESDVNFNLANNIIALVYWGIYIIMVFLLLKIPTSALTIITTGLATGIGFAMKDVLNNFFYGIQLMGGRVRVGDTIECDGIRGVVQSLSYQSTQVAAEDGSVIAFTNTALFNKNFKNLTRNNYYEMIKFIVGVKYGTDVEKARDVILEALKPLQVRDKYGREVVDPKKGINVRLSSFGDSSVDISVSLFATVDAHYSFAAQAKEAIYNAFAQNDIEIPFPQQDIYIKEMPVK